MKGIKFIAGVVATLFSCSVAMASSPQIITSGHNNGKISIIDINSNKVVWTHRLEKGEHCNSIQPVNGGKNIAYTTIKGVKVMSVEKSKVLWSYEISDTEHEVHSIFPTKSGGFMLFIAGTDSRIIEFSSKYKIVKEIHFDSGTPNKHGAFRQAVVSKSGDFLIPSMSTSSVNRISSEGKLIESYQVGGKAFGITERANGNFLLGLGDKHVAVEYDPSTKSVVRRISKLETRMMYIAQVEEVEPNVFLLANWSGHSKQNPAVTLPSSQLVMFDGDSKVLWRWNDGEQKIGKIAAFYYSSKPLVK